MLQAALDGSLICTSAYRLHAPKAPQALPASTRQSTFNAFVNPEGLLFPVSAV